MDFKVEDRGVRRALSAVSIGVTRLEPAWSDVGVEVMDRMRPLVPVLTGALLSSIDVEVNGSGVAVGIAGPTQVYARVQSYGSPSHGIAPSGFMQAGAAAAGDAVAGAVSDGIQDLINRVGLG